MVSGQILQPIRSMQDIAQLIKVAQQNREVSARLSFDMPVAEMRRRSHLIVRLIPDNIMGYAPVIDFVELCGSEFAASPSTATNSHEHEKDRKFATSSFNSLSQALLAAAFKQPFKKDSHTNLTKVLCQSLLSKNAKVVFVANLSNTPALIKHSFTALKFSSKIREAIYKRFARIE